MATPPLSPPPKFQGKAGSPIGPQTPEDWIGFYRWLYSQYLNVKNTVGSQVLSLQTAPQIPPHQDPGVALPFRAPAQPATKPDGLSSLTRFPFPYHGPTIGPTAIDLIANQGNYPPSSYLNWLYLASDTLLLYYSDGTNWNELTPAMGGAGYPTDDVTGNFPDPKLNTTGVTAGSYGDGTHVGNFIVDAKGRINGAAAVAIIFPNPTMAQIISALGYAPAQSGANATFSLTAPAGGGPVTGTITQV